MQVITWNQFLEKGLQTGNLPAAVTVGVFDGVHRGHRELLAKIVSHNVQYTPVVVTFKENHKIGVSELIMRNVECGMKRESTEICSFQERLEMFEKLGIKIVIVIEFTDEFRQMPGIYFLETLLKHGNIGFFAAGEDFRCGYQLDTDAKAIRDFFKSRGVAAEIVPQVLEESLPISSSRIRKAIAAGDTEAAEKMLGCRLS